MFQLMRTKDWLCLSFKWIMSLHRKTESKENIYWTHLYLLYLIDSVLSTSHTFQVCYPVTYIQTMTKKVNTYVISVFETHQTHLKQVWHAHIAERMEGCWHLWRSGRFELPLTWNLAHIRSCCLSWRQDTTNQLLNGSSCISQLQLSLLALISDSKSAFCSLLSAVFPASSHCMDSAAMPWCILNWCIKTPQF